MLNVLRVGMLVIVCIGQTIMDLVCRGCFRAVLLFVEHGNFDLYSVIISRCLLTMYVPTF